MNLVATAGRRSASLLALIVVASLAFFTLPLVAGQGGAGMLGGSVLDLQVTFGLDAQTANQIALLIDLFGRAAADYFPFIAPFIDTLLMLPLQQRALF